MAHKLIRTMRKTFVVILVNFVLLICLIFIIEGLCSILRITEAAFFKNLIAERQHTQYDEEIGWINIPNLYLKDTYFGESFITNSMSFRNDKEFNFSLPPNKVRVICSGDSFTMGYGVGNDDAWCQQLESIDSRIESVNLGQGGYGVDQAYLWYKRNSSKLEHDIHIFAFITEDFNRMQNDSFSGYGKPFLVIQDNALVNINKPVPKRSYLLPRLPLILREFSKLNAITIFQRKSLQKDPLLVLEEKNKKNNYTKKIVTEIMADLHDISTANNSSLVLILLPIKSDYMGKDSEDWRHFLHAESAKHDFIFFDLIDEFRKYPPQEVETLFGKHYSPKGNAYIARIIYEKLFSIPEIASRFQDKQIEIKVTAVPFDPLVYPQ